MSSTLTMSHGNLFFSARFPTILTLLPRPYSKEEAALGPTCLCLALRPGGRTRGPVPPWKPRGNLSWLLLCCRPLLSFRSPQPPPVSPSLCTGEMPCGFKQYVKECSRKPYRNLLTCHACKSFPLLALTCSLYPPGSSAALRRKGFRMVPWSIPTAAPSSCVSPPSG